MVHLGAWDWHLTDQGDGTSALALPTPAHRAERLNHLVILYDLIAETYLVVAGVDLGGMAGSQMTQAVHTILDDSILNEMIAGGYD
jgi:hypothetical protein